jgi:ferrochelatase|tara:strand:- start:327 stop:1319 length:993 start_codon:yes stop_codon:yes gene_type:complete
MKFKGEQNFQHENEQKKGVLIAYLGTPDSPDVLSVRRYLKEFLSDPRIIEVPKIIWWFILNIFILNFRSFNSARLYKSIWTDGGSPLLVNCLKIKEKVQKSLPSNYQVALGMRYGNPSIKSALNELKEANCRDIEVITLFPHYSATTVGSIFDAVSTEIKSWRWVPSVKFLNSYHDNPLLIEILSKRIKKSFESQGKPDKLVFSYHSIPKKYFDSGDPYHCLCQKTSRLIAEKLSLDEKDYITAFQSRFGPSEWLKPYTSETMKSLPKEGIKSVQVVSPGFGVDNLETLQEIDIENKEYFEDAGGENFHYIPCLNDDDDHVEFLISLIGK